MAESVVVDHIKRKAAIAGIVQVIIMYTGSTNIVNDIDTLDE